MRKQLNVTGCVCYHDRVHSLHRVDYVKRHQHNAATTESSSPLKFIIQILHFSFFLLWGDLFCYRAADKCSACPLNVVALKSRNNHELKWQWSVTDSTCFSCNTVNYKNKRIVSCHWPEHHTKINDLNKEAINVNMVFISMRILRCGNIFFLSSFLWVFSVIKSLLIKTPRLCVVAVLWMNHTSVNGHLCSGMSARQVHLSEAENILLRGFLTKWHWQL